MATQKRKILTNQGPFVQSGLPRSGWGIVVSLCFTTPPPHIRSAPPTTQGRLYRRLSFVSAQTYLTDKRQIVGFQSC